MNFWTVLICSVVAVLTGYLVGFIVGAFCAASKARGYADEVDRWITEARQLAEAREAARNN